MIKLEKIRWSDDAWNGLELALGEQLPDIAAEVITGKSELWSVDGHGYVVTRYEIHNNYKSLVLIAGQGWKRDGQGYIECVKAFCNIAAGIGADRVEMNTHRRGIGRMVEGLGFKEVERKYELDIRGISNG